MPLREALNVAWQTAAVLAELESHGIVHRDLRPGNLMLVPDAVAAQGVRLKILDLGLAKLNRELFASAVHTRCGMVMGTPMYMSPEQCCDASDVDGKRDVYSLGAVLFKMLTGQPPYVTAGSQSMLALHMFAPAPRFKDVAKGVSETLAELVTAMLSKRAADRPTMARVRDGLARLLNQPLANPDGALVTRQATATSQDCSLTNAALVGMLARLTKGGQRWSETLDAIVPAPLAMTKMVLTPPNQRRVVATHVLALADTLVRDTQKDLRPPSFLDRSQRDLTVPFTRLSFAAVPLARIFSTRSPVLRGALAFLISILLWMGGQTPNQSPNRSVSFAKSAPAGSDSTQPKPATWRSRQQARLPTGS